MNFINTHIENDTFLYTQFASRLKIDKYVWFSGITKYAYRTILSWIKPWNKLSTFMTVEVILRARMPTHIHSVTHWTCQFFCCCCWIAFAKQRSLLTLQYQYRTWHTHTHRYDLILDMSHRQWTIKPWQQISFVYNAQMMLLIEIVDMISINEATVYALFECFCLFCLSTGFSLRWSFY